MPLCVPGLIRETQAFRVPKRDTNNGHVSLQLPDSPHGSPPEEC